MSNNKRATRENTKKGDVIYFIDSKGIYNYWEVLSENLQDPRVKLKKVKGNGGYGHREGEVSYTTFSGTWFHSIKKRYARELE